MDDEITLVGYHATDKQYVDGIIKDRFICKPNDKHWLGNGYYFFYDKALAHWWSTNPTREFGAGINSLAIIQATILCEQEKTMNLLSLESYNELNILWTEFYSGLCLSKKELIIGEYQKIRCLFFDWVHSEYHCDVIIAAFYKNKPRYVEGKNHKIFLRFALPYPEIQICVFNNINITNKKELQ